MVIVGVCQVGSLVGSGLVIVNDNGKHIMKRIIVVFGVVCMSIGLIHGQGCDPAPSGLVGWWKGGGDASDSVGGNNGVLVNGNYTDGMVGQAFAFDPENYPNGTYSGVQIPDSPAYVLTNALTIEGWIHPRGNSFLIFWRGDNRIGFDPYYLSFDGNNYLHLTITAADNSSDEVGVTVGYGSWIHVAATFDSVNGNLSIYTNGVLASQKGTLVRPFGQLIAEDHPGIGIGNLNDGQNSFCFYGDIDEIGLYSRALSSNEIAAIYNAGSAGKCVTPVAPVITAQPTNQTVLLGGTANISVAATGTAPLSYQWSCNTTNIVGATNATLTFSSVQLTNAGNYSVTITNIAGSTNSDAATLTVNVLVCTPAPSGLVAWWRAEGNASDSIGTNNGALIGGVTYTNGEVGQGFKLDNVNTSTSYIRLPASPSLNIGTSGGFTIESWVKPNAQTLHGGAPIIEWDSASTDGLQFWVDLSANIKDTSGNAHNLVASGLLNTNSLQHVALTYDKSSGQAVMYYNGAAVTTVNFGNITPQTTYPVNIGRRTGQPIGNGSNYGGLIDELSLYTRALSSNEIAAIYNAGSAGKCYTPVAPVITAQPTNQTVLVGGTAAFSVTATGTAPLNYQWAINGTNITGASSATLTLNNVQLTNAGNYSVTITNSVGSTNSVAATLTVNVPVCTPAPSGLVGWWPAEGNANDIVGGNNGMLVSGAGYTNGEVGQAFSFNNSGTQAVDIPLSPSLNITNQVTIEFWMKAAPGNSMNSFQGLVTSDNYFISIDVGNPNLGGYGVDFAINDSGTFYQAANANGGGAHVSAGVWHHIAGTYDGTKLQLYVDGQPWGNPLLHTGAISPLVLPGEFISIGSEDGRASCGCTGRHFWGLIDEASIYNRALSASEIAAIYNAGSAGKCFTPVAPAITAQPTNQTVLVGGTAAISVAATGTAPLSYQWSRNGANIIGATNTTLTLSNVQLTNAGNYSVTITNIAGSTNSVAATLTVNVPVCTPAPSGLVSWWPAEGNANDVIGGNNGTLVGGAGFATGEVGQAFSFNGTSGYVSIPDSPSLDSFTNSVTIELWLKVNRLTTNPDWVWIVTKGNSSWELQCTVYAKTVTFNASGTSNTSLNGNRNINDGQWHHVAGVYDGTNMFIYVDGTLDASQPSTGLIAQNSYPVEFGQNAEAPRAIFNGSMDEVSLYHRALSASEIAAIYNAGIAGKCFTPVAPVITAQPTNQTVLVGGTGALSVAATGTGPLSYQWAFNGTNIDGATVATLNLGNVQLAQAGNYSVLVSNIVGSTNSIAATLAVVLPPVITQQPQSQSVASYNSASFTVAATGSGSLTYQWRKSGTNLVDGGNVSGSATTNLNLASVSLNDAGSYYVVVSNPYATTNSAVAVLTVPQTGMLLGSASAMSGNTVVVPVLMNALGVENTFQTSVGYDPTTLVLQGVQLGNATAGAYFVEVDTKTNSGLVGFVIFLNEGTAMPAGTNEQVALLTFQAQPVTSNTNISLFFTNNPVDQETYDNSIHLLPVVYSNGIVTLLPAEYAADVYPRTNGDSKVNTADWLEMGRMVAGLDVPTSSDEMLRADCAPRNAPDGLLTVADWVQAGRYALKLDPLTLVTLTPVPGAEIQKSMKFTPLADPGPVRTLQIGSVAAQRGQTVSVPVQLVCAAGENAVGLTVSFDADRLKLTGVTMGSAMTGGKTNINYNQPGKLGMVVAMMPNTSLAAGTNQILVLQFATFTNASGPAALTLDSSVVQLQVADKTANVLAANYVSGAVVLPPQPTMTTVKAGENLQLTWPISTGTFHVESADNPLGPWSDAALTITTNGASATVTVTPTDQHQFFRLVGQ